MQLGIYRHYKGGEFLVFGTAKYEETLEPVVLYQHLFGEYDTWVRPQSVFEETVDIPEYSYHGPRFAFVRPWTEADALLHPEALSFLPQPAA